MEGFENPVFSKENNEEKEPNSPSFPRESQYQFKTDLDYKIAYENECKYSESLKQELEKFKELDKNIQEKYKKNNDEYEALKHDVNFLKDSLIKIKDKYTKKKNENKELIKNKNEFEKLKKELTENINRLESENMKVLLMKEELEISARKLNEIKSEIIIIQKKNELLINEKNEIETHYHELLDKSTDISVNYQPEKDNKEMNEKMNKLSKEIQNQENMISKFDQENILLKQENLNLNKELLKLKDEIFELEKQKKEIKKENDLLKENIDKSQLYNNSESKNPEEINPLKTLLTKKENEIKLISKELTDLRLQVEKLESNLQSEERINQERLQSLEKSLNENGKLRKDLAKICEENRLSYMQLLEENNNYLNIVDNLQNKINSYKNQIINLEDQISDNFNKQKNNEQNNNINYLSELKNLNNIIEEKNDKIQQILNEKNNYQSKCNSEKREFLSQIENFKKNESFFKNEIDNLKSLYKQSENSYKILNDSNERLKKSIFSLSEEAAKLKKYNEILEIEKNRIEKEKNILNKKIEDPEIKFKNIPNVKNDNYNNNEILVEEKTIKINFELKDNYEKLEEKYLKLNEKYLKMKQIIRNLMKKKTNLQSPKKNNSKKTMFEIMKLKLKNEIKEDFFHLKISKLSVKLVTILKRFWKLIEKRTETNKNPNKSSMKLIFNQEITMIYYKIVKTLNEFCICPENFDFFTNVIEIEMTNLKFMEEINDALTNSHNIIVEFLDNNNSLQKSHQKINEITFIIPEIEVNSQEINENLIKNRILNLLKISKDKINKKIENELVNNEIKINENEKIDENWLLKKRLEIIEKIENQLNDQEEFNILNLVSCQVEDIINIINIE